MWKNSQTKSTSTQQLKKIPSSRTRNQWRVLYCRTTAYLNSFVPKAIQYVTNQYKPVLILIWQYIVTIYIYLILSLTLYPCLALWVLSNADRTFLLPIYNILLYRKLSILLLLVLTNHENIKLLRREMAKLCVEHLY